MRPFHPIQTAVTVNALVTELFDLVDPVTGSVGADRLNGAATALRDANEGLLPEDETPIDPLENPYVRVPYISRIPRRLPPESGSLRTDFASIGVRNVEVAAKCSVAWLLDNLPGSPVEADVRRLRDIARLMRVSGLDRATAVHLHDHGTTPIQTPAELASADTADVKAMVLELVAGGFPAELAQVRPWNLWRRHARIMTRTRKTRVNPAPTPWSADIVSQRAGGWRGLAESSVRTVAERQSADAITFALDVQSALLRGNFALCRRNHKVALEQYREVWYRIGQRALSEGLVEEGSTEVYRPTVETVIKTVGVLLDRVRDEDVDSALAEVSARSAPLANGLRAFTLADLDTVPAGTVRTALAAHPVSVLGRKGAIAVDTGLGERTKGNLNVGLAQGLGTPNTGARVVDLGEGDGEQLRQNVRAFSIDTLQDDTTLWSSVEKSFHLRDVRAAVGACLDVGGNTPTASSVLKSSVLSSYPSSLTANMGPFDRFYAFVPSSSRRMATMYVPTGANFASRYRLGVLQPMMESAKSEAWQLTESDFADPARFLFLLPQMCLSHLPRAMAAGYRYAGRQDISASILRGSYVSASALTNPITASVSNWTTAGVIAEASAIDCDQIQQDWATLADYLHTLNSSADTAYQEGSYSAAAADYRKVIAVAEACGDSTIGQFVANLDVLREDLLARIQQVQVIDGVERRVTDPTLHAYSMLEYQVTADATDPDILANVFGDAVIWERPEYLATNRTIALAESLNPSMVMASLELYGAGGPVILEAQTREGGENQQDVAVDEDEDADSWLGPEVYQPLPPRVGGPCGSGPGSTVVFVDTDLVLAEIAHAATFLAQIEQGLNWLGFDPGIVPVWRFDYLLERARYFASKADEIQQRSFAVLSAAETAALEELAALQQAMVAAQGVEVANAQYDLACAQCDAADAALEAAQNQLERSRDDVTWAWVGLGASAAATVAGGITGEFIFRKAAQEVKDVAGVVGGSGGGVTGVVGAFASVDQAYENVEASQDSVKVQKAAVDVADAGKALAVEQVALAQLEAANAYEYYQTLMNDQETTSRNLFALLGAVEAISVSYLRMANRLAWLAERAYQFESRLSTNFIRMSYELEGDFVQRFSGAAKLLVDLDAVEHARLTGTRDRYQLVKATFSLGAYDPINLILLQQTGRCLFSISQQQVDERFPGLFLHCVRRIEVEFDGLVPASGVTAVLSTVNTSVVRVPNNTQYVDDPAAVAYDWAYPSGDFAIGGADSAEEPPYVLKPLVGVGFSQTLSEYREASDGGVLSPPPGALDTFENMGVAVTWLLDIPRTGNGFDLTGITDVRFVIYFRASYDAALAARQAAVLAAGRATRTLTLPATETAADAFTDFTVGPSDTSYRDLRLLAWEVSSDMLPKNILASSTRLQNVTVALVQEGESSVMVRARASIRPKPANATVTYGNTDEAIDGLVFSAVGDQTISYDLGEGDVVEHTSRQGTFPNLDDLVNDVDDEATGPSIADSVWVLKVLPEDNPSLLLLDDDGDTVSVSGGFLALDAGATATYTGGSWKHAEARASVRIPTSSTLTIGLRDNGTNKVFATLSTTSVSLGDGTNTSASVANVIVADEWTEVRLRVVDDEATLTIDGVEVAMLSNLAVTAAGTVAFASASGSSQIRVGDVRVTQLRYDGTELQEVVSEAFETDADAWTKSTGASWTSETHNVLDLSFLQDVVLILDYTGEFDL